jgi:hypothetical protein
MAWREITDENEVAEIYKGYIIRASRVSLQSLDRFRAEMQFNMDIAMWYGFLDKISDQERKRWKHATVSRVFNLLLNGGLMVRRSDVPSTWVKWSRKGGPVASVISHTARVLVQLPAGRKGREFWHWLWCDQAPQGRMAATHGIESDISQLLGEHSRKFTMENKTGSTCNHYGINIALGGEGNTNPVSGNRIYPNGEHGHLYFALSKKNFRGRKVLLIATEQSAPADRYSGKSAGGVKNPLSSFGRFLGSGFGVPDQYGGKHGFGGHNDRAANGGQDWTDGYLKTGQTNRLTNYGPGPDGSCYLDGMFIDLTDNKFDSIKNLAFTKDMLGLTPR